MKILATVLMLGALAGAGAQAAPAYPDRPIRIEVGFPPGGAIDTIARTIAPKMAESLGQAVVVENRPGAGGIISAQSVARSSPDGYTLFMGTMGNFSITPALKKDLPYSVEKDFAPITLVASSDFVLYVNPDLPVKDVSQLIAYSKSHPQGIHFSSSGLGGLPHMAGEMFNAATGAKMVHVPYKGSSPSISDVMAGQVQLTFEAAAIGLPFVKAGKLRALATTGEKRSPSFPDVPTVNETVPGFIVSNWFGLAAPANTPAPVVHRLQQEVAKVMQDPAVVSTLRGLGVEPVASTPESFASYLKEENLRWAQVIKDADIKLD